MTEKGWLWTAIITGGIILGVLFNKQTAQVGPNAKPSDGWVPGGSNTPPLMVQPPGNIQPPSTQPQPQPQQPGSVYDGLLRNAKEQNKQMVLFFTSKNCVYCERMKKEVLPNVKVQQALGRYIYHVVDLDLEPAFAQKFSVTALPTIMIIDGTERVQKQSSGYMAADVLINWLGGQVAPPSPTDPQPRPQQPQRQPLRRPGGS